MKFIATLLIIIFLFSCKDNQEKFDYQTSMASKIYEAQTKYFDETLLIYARMSNQGMYFYNESKYLDTITNGLKDKIKDGSTISENEKANFFGHFEKTFTNHALIDTQILNQLKQLPIKTISDIDLLKLYIKNNYVCILLNNKLLPFDMWGSSVFTTTTTIKYGEEFQAELMTIASSHNEPTEWFLVKNNTSGIDKENIIDTLRPDMRGVVDFRTKKYSKGQNKLTFVSRMNNQGLRDKTIRKEIEFYVK